ncbi:MAG: hypothetical protein HYX28_10705 [Candidatus Koribacter versatilis]|uniref:CBU-0592-like domain-containing protein n=1 Tax=Candidatus Korobacter versatilis TaxID=658062 RepID=A0A932A9S4_9BACT|nr:hypothetical protein [Candidatus Koribacter versatilis]
MEISLATQIESFVGAALILIGYIGHQAKWMDARRPAYNGLNAAGAAILAWIALRPLQVGFAIMEVTWTVVSLVALARVMRSPRSTVDSPQ